MIEGEQDQRAIWQAALDREPRREDAIALLADAAAFGLSESGLDPAPICRRLHDAFDLFQIASHLGVQQ